MRHNRSRRNSGPILSRPVWGAIWGIVGLLCLLSILPIDGVLLKWLHRASVRSSARARMSCRLR